MNTRKAVGVMLIVIGLISLLVGGISWNRQKTIVDIGPLKAETTERKTLPIPPIIGGLALLGGVVLLVAPARRRVEEVEMTAKNLIAPVALMLVVGLGVAPRAVLADQGRGNEDGRGGEKAERAREKAEDRGDEKARRDDVVVIDREGHRRVVRDYYTSNALPPGLAKRQSLPPGLQKQLREHGTLPPGLQKQLTPVPPALGGRLPGVPAYYTRYFAGRDLLVVDTRTNRIVSIIPDVIP